MNERGFLKTDSRAEKKYYNKFVKHFSKLYGKGAGTAGYNDGFGV